MGRHTRVVQRSFTINNKLGLHARAAAKLVQITNQFQSRIRLLKNGQEADAKSILGILTLCCLQGARIEIHAEGDDAPEAVNAVARLFENNFGEE